MCRPTSRGSAGNGSHNSGGIQAGIADDQARDFDFEKTEMKYDSTGMFHWSPARSLEDCILVQYIGGKEKEKKLLSSFSSPPRLIPSDCLFRIVIKLP